MKYSERDLSILALTVYGAARGEPSEGKVRAVWSARNRAEADLWSDDRDDWGRENHHLMLVAFSQLRSRRPLNQASTLN